MKNLTPKNKALQLIDKFTYWNTSQAEREGILSALNVVSEILEIIEIDDLKYWDDVRDEILIIKNS
jgi:hypothetical protein